MNRWVLQIDRALEIVRKLDWVALGVARWTVGLEFISTGWGKVHHLDRVASFFGELGIPAPGANALLASFTELVCGTLLVVGLGSRLAACPLVVTMVVAIVTAKRDELHGVTDLVGLVEWTYIAILGIVAVLGPGAASLDALISKALRKSNS
ncbi:MAG: DoxX family protein [Polyangiaceae bacterium]|jgi:putative oxidoreductase